MSDAIALVALTTADLDTYLATAAERTRRWVAAQQFRAQPLTSCVIPDADGGVAEVLVGIASASELNTLAHLPATLPAGDYSLCSRGVQLDHARVALGFALASYQFKRYKAARREPARLLAPLGTYLDEVAALVAATTRTRDLVNTPTEDMGPAELGTAAREIAERFGAQYREWIGNELLEANFPAIHAVGRASHRAPRLIEVRAGDPAHPEVAIIGKGVCFDTGGLDIKAADGMRNMKKDMGGAAHAIALAELVLERRLPIRLRLLVPAVENAIGANAYRPGEVIRTRAGLSVEIDNTDAEGRVVLCDALAYAAESKPKLIVDFATLTGAARIALGPDLPPLFGNDEALRDRLVELGREVQDPLWPMPLWQPYLAMLESGIADLANSGPSRHAGAITAALYLQRFVPPNIPWLHLDTYAWNDNERPGRPRGGEAMGLRAVYELLKRDYGAS
ncbi:MAG: leucyl aminopeptidase family protein [Xanthomonadales bacterium]|nr:leucyl aminopeptidase family protein [Xanthomonadales bacterium]MCC6560377.1 leucyl aminopeptidase family protein [Xanthomonadales bacterium]